MNLTCLEFVACQSEKMGPLILSEFAGSAQCLSGAILVNPWDQQRIVRAINEALNMNDDQVNYCVDKFVTLVNRRRSDTSTTWTMLRVMMPCFGHKLF
jgi:trehalose-6-phosphate synthase